ncbi:glycosyltransferase family 2 protein [Agrobacterium tumefaciens]|uniref:glycosyltransferase family 2 protein n=1 Tax=Agrobacterium tumefaciens TaxID=358 RepID=UPI0021D2D750|nr:glycosyltransferase family 2 protein [Agrobacterium tumefaciens]UXS03430.1 glycosyltransferase family 2 protein [Agrobacterium tumefaciens]
MAILPLSSVTVVSVCYKSDALIRDMVLSIPDATPIILVDNGKTTDFSNLPESRKISLLFLDENIGFGRGCNAGAELVETPWILFLNPDARLKQGALEALLEAANRHPSAIAFNPRIFNADGTQYFKRRSWLLSNNNSGPRGWPDNDTPVPILSGAAFFVSKTSFDQVGGFDPKIFMYHEDDDLSLRLAALGDLFFVRGSKVVHASGNSSGRSPEIARLKAYHMARSRIYTGEKHHIRHAYASTLLQAALLLLSPQNIFSKRRRAKAIGFLRGTLSKIFS